MRVFTEAMEDRRPEFAQALSELAGERVTAFLTSLSGPCYESELMREGFPEFRILGAAPLELFQKHFLLFHWLYRLQERFFAENRYLHIHFMRTSLVDYPERGKCRFYEPHLGSFCADQLLDATEYCAFHRGMVGDDRLELLSERFFYLDFRNYFALNEGTAREFLDGSWEVLRRHEEIRAALAVLDLPARVDVKTIKSAFREFARTFHPDAGGDGEERFKQINNAYHLLMRLFTRPGGVP